MRDGCVAHTVNHALGSAAAKMIWAIALHDPRASLPVCNVQKGLRMHSMVHKELL